MARKTRCQKVNKYLKILAEDKKLKNTDTLTMTSMLFQLLLRHLDLMDLMPWIKNIGHSTGEK
jgi:hypothetical protein